jgi:glycosyltransferase involved in cell wall biosynthesis
MRLLVLHSELGVLRGGGENFSRNLFSAFSARGHRVAAAFVADLRSRYPLSMPAGIDPIPIAGWWSSNLGQSLLSAIGRRIPGESSFHGHWERVQDAVSWRTWRWHCRRFQRRVHEIFACRWKEYDAVYVHGDTTLASQVARHRPTILRLPGPVGPDLATKLKEVHAVCANGDALARVRQFLGDHVTELPVGLDTELFKPCRCSVRARLNWADEMVVIGYVGRLARLKGVDILADGFRRVCQTLPNVRLLMVGTGEEESNLRTALAPELKRGLVHFEPGVEHEELPNWYRAMDLLVMPSRYENFSNAVLEAMACGVPLLASDVGGNRMLASANAGWLFDSGSSASLAEHLQQIIQDRPNLRLRGAAAADYVRRQSSWSQTARQLEDIISMNLGIRA